MVCDKEIIKELSLKDVINHRNTKVVVVGGGTGSSVILRGIKKYTDDITAIVTVADDGGGSGMLREDLGMLPPGDIRSCILALADDESIMQPLLNYRFKEGRLKGQNFGNIFIAAMDALSDDFVEAIRKISDVLAVKGTVLPVTLEDVVLTAVMENGELVRGESNISKIAKLKNLRIEKVFIEPSKVSALKYSVEAIMDADIVILGPGSLYTSLIPNLLVDKIEEAFQNTKAQRYFVTNVMTQPGETTGYSVEDHIKSIENHLDNSNKRIFDYVIYNCEEIPQNIIDKYRKEGGEVVCIRNKNDSKYKLISENLVDIKSNYIRHDADKLAHIIFSNYKKNRKIE